MSQTQLSYQAILRCAVVSPSLLEGGQLHSQCLLSYTPVSIQLHTSTEILSSDSNWTFLHGFLSHPNHSLEKLLFGFFFFPDLLTPELGKQKSGSDNAKPHLPPANFSRCLIDEQLDIVFFCVHRASCVYLSHGGNC